MTDTGNVRVGVLSLHNSKETKAILNAIEALGHQPVWLREANVAIRIEDGTIRLRPDIDVLANRLMLTNTDQPEEALGISAIYADVVPLLNPPEQTLLAIHKFATASTLAAAGLPVPDALLGLSPDDLASGRAEFGEEVVYKTAIGTHGGGTWKVGPDESITPTVGKRYAFVQELVGNESGPERDLRVYVVGDSVIGGMYRYAPDDDWRTNVALGGSTEEARLPTGVGAIAREAVDVIGLDYAGVDLVEGPDGWVVLEVNPTAGFKGFYEATGVSPGPYIAKLAIEAGGGAVDDDRVSELKAVLDDSVPACKPSRPTIPTDERTVIGYTEEVVIGGTTGSEMVIAKSDTGAARTSVDTSVAAKIGAGPITEIASVRSGSNPSGATRPVVDVVVRVNGNRHTVQASITDRDHMDYPVLLGRDVLENYHVDSSRRVDTPTDDEPEE